MTPYFAEHLGTAFLRAMLAREGIGSAQYLPPRNPSLAGFARDLGALRPAVVGFTAYESNLRACRAMARVVCETLPEAVVAVGGPNATFSPEETLEIVGADLCLRGAGEGTIVPIVEAVLGAGRSARRRLPDLVAEVPNLVLRTAGAFQSTPAGDLSSFPGGRFRCLDDVPSPYQAGLVSTADVGILTARGCNQHCTYCSFAAISRRRIHFHGVERVLEDLAAFKPLVARVERRRPTVSINDDAFTLAPQRAREICEGIVARGLQMPFECVTRGDQVDADLLRLMKRAGFTAVSFGLESAVPRVLRAIGKVRPPAADGDPEYAAEHAFLDRLRASLAATKAAGIVPSVSIIAGLPGETAADLRATLAFVESLGVASYVHNELMLFPGTPLHEDAARHGLRAEREGACGPWHTTYAYDVSSVPPLPSASTLGDRWDEAHEISDGLCGRPRTERADDGATWCVVLHGGEPDRALAAWLAEILAVHGAVVVVGDGPAGDHGAWQEVLDEARVPWGTLALLSPDGPPDARTLRSSGTVGDHRFVLEPEWRASGSAAEVDGESRLRVPIWIASGAAGPPPRTREPLPATLQIADGCRWWTGWRRCRRPRVLHVASDGKVRPCWKGPEIGRVGDPYAELVRRGSCLAGVARSSAGPDGDGCPLGTASGGDRDAGSSPAAYEAAAQSSWLFRAAPRRERRAG